MVMAVDEARQQRRRCRVPMTGTFGCWRAQVGEGADRGDRAVLLQHGAVGDLLPAMAIDRAGDHRAAADQ